MTKATLKLKLKAMKTHVGAIPVDIKVRMRMEKRLVPWVVANLPCFPELLSQPFVFCNMVPVIVSLINLFIIHANMFTVCFIFSGCLV
jgi:hypothetical protein